MKRRFPPVVLHVLFSVAFLALPYVFAPQGFATLTTFAENPHERTVFLSYVLMLGAFYLNYYALIPRLYFRKKYGWFVASVVGCFLLIMGVLVWVDRRDLFGPTPPTEPRTGPLTTTRQSPPPPPGAEGLQKPPFGFELSHSLFLFLVGLFVSLSLRINQRFRQTEREKIATELAYLKAQINPHFLFNTLNSIYALAIENSDRTPDAVVKLSGLMRYVIRDADREFVPLAKELEYVENYVALQKLRLDDTARVAFNIEGTPNGNQIAPLILISFIENAFKYGVNPEEKSLIQIGITLRGDELRLRVFNKKVRVQHVPDGEGGLGIENTRARLHLLYPARHHLTLRDDTDGFTVDLNLKMV